MCWAHKYSFSVLSVFSELQGKIYMCNPAGESRVPAAEHLFHLKGMTVVSGGHWPWQLSLHPSCVFLGKTWLDRTHTRLVQGTCDKIFFCVFSFMSCSACEMCWLWQQPRHTVPLSSHKWGPQQGASALDPPSQVGAAGAAVPAGMRFTWGGCSGHRTVLFTQVTAGVSWQGLYSVTGL